MIIIIIIIISGRETAVVAPPAPSFGGALRADLRISREGK